MRRNVIRLFSAFETLDATLTVYFSALYAMSFLKAHHHRDTTFDPGLSGLVRK